MSESQMRSTLVKALQSLDAVAIESPKTGIGIPDVNYVGGWIECKYLPKWPVRAMTQPVRFNHKLSKEQKIWLRRRQRQGGTALLCLKVERSWFFYDAETGSEWFDKMTRPQMSEKAIFQMQKMDRAGLLTWLRSISKG